jgi:hypothetical protein
MERRRSLKEGRALFLPTWYERYPWSWRVDDYAYTEGWFGGEPELDEATIERALRGELGARSVTCCPRGPDSLDELEYAADHCGDEDGLAHKWARKRLRDTNGYSARP